MSLLEAERPTAMPMISEPVIEDLIYDQPPDPIMLDRDRTLQLLDRHSDTIDELWASYNSYLADTSLLNGFSVAAEVRPEHLVSDSVTLYDKRRAFLKQANPKVTEMFAELAPGTRLIIGKTIFEAKIGGLVSVPAQGQRTRTVFGEIELLDAQFKAGYTYASDVEWDFLLVMLKTEAGKPYANRQERLFEVA